MTQTVPYLVEGMTCAACAGRVERALRAVPGVSDAAVNLVSGKAMVTFAGPVDSAAVAATLSRAGYPVTEVRTRLEVQGMTCASCVGRVERALRAVPGVSDASVNLVTGQAQVRFAAGATSGPELAARVTAAGYAATAATDDAGPASVIDRQAAEEAALRRRFLLALALALPTVLLSMGAHAVPALHHWLMAHIGERAVNGLQSVLTLAVLAGPGRAFLTHGLPALWRGAPEMNALVAVGSLAAFLYSAVATYAPALLPEGSRAVYYEAAASIVTLILLGRWLEARARDRAGQAISRLAALQPATARVIRPDGTELDLPAADLHPGDLVRLRPGERVAADGLVAEGASFIDESMLTGEPMPVGKGLGAAVAGGTVNGTGTLTFQVTATGRGTVLAQIQRLVEEAQAAKLPVQALVDRITLWFVPAVMGLALMTALVWLAFGPAPALPHALVAGLSVLIIACPCAMGLATPVSILVGSGRGAELGILFRRGDALQSLAGVGIVGFDKTGTLTEGHPEVAEVIVAAGIQGANRDDILRLAPPSPLVGEGWGGGAPPAAAQSPLPAPPHKGEGVHAPRTAGARPARVNAAVTGDADHALAIAAAAEAGSEHPLARAILAEAQARGLALPVATAGRALPGLGYAATVGGRPVLIGNRAALSAAGIDPGALTRAADTAASQGKTPVFVAEGGQVLALITIADRVKPSAATAVARLAGAGVAVALISGDTDQTARAVAAGLGIAKTVAGVLPAAKPQALAGLAQGRRTAFVGDGINDAPALAAADVGIAMGTGTGTAMAAADVVLMAGDPARVADAILLSRATLRNIRQNLFWAFGYNALLIPVAAGALYPLNGLMLSPVLASAAMALSSVFVVTNALRLRRFRPGR